MTRLYMLQTHDNFQQSKKYITGQENPIWPFPFLAGSTHMQNMSNAPTSTSNLCYYKPADIWAVGSTAAIQQR